MRRRAFLQHLLLGTALPALPALGGGTALARVMVVRAEDGAVAEEFLASLRKAMSGRAVVDEIRLVEALPEIPGDIRLIVPVGVRALRATIAAGPSVPVLAALVPRQAYERAVGGAAGRRITAVYLDQPYARQLALIRLALPERKRVGVLLGNDSRHVLSLLQRPADLHEMQLVESVVESERALLLSLQGVLSAADVLLAIPDPTVHNSAAIQNILLAAYRRGVPVVGFSSAYTRAGALLSLHSSPVQLAQQVADAALDILSGRPLPAPRGPREFEVSVNRQVARSMGIDVPGDAQLIQGVRQMAGGE